jgi:exosortase/archaeosortase family protein
VSPASTTNTFAKSPFLGITTSRPFLLLSLVLTLLAIGADQFFAPILHTSSPIWATVTVLLLVWRRRAPGGETRSDPGLFAFPLTWRVVAFVIAHAVIVILAKLFGAAFQTVSGTPTLMGALLAALKLCVLAPTLLLFSVETWKGLLRTYSAEAIAGAIVLLTYFPSRVLLESWPWYGRALGRLVYLVARIFVPGLTYAPDANPTIGGPDLDVTIVPDCSGLNGVELFDYLFSIVAILDWNRLRKRRALIGYFLGVFVMLLGNAARITSFVVLGNHGYAETVSRFHISAGWIFFSAVFLAYLSLAYGWMLRKRRSGISQEQSS